MEGEKCEVDVSGKRSKCAGALRTYFLVSTFHFNLRVGVVVRRIDFDLDFDFDSDIDVVFRSRCDIVKLDRAVVLEIVDGIDAAAAALLDRAARLVVLIRSALLAAQALGRRGRTEVRAAVASTRTHRAAAAGAWTAKPAASGTRSAEATTTTGRARSVSLTRRPRRTILAGASLADRQVPSLEGLCVEPLDDLLGLSAIGELHEGKAARTSGFAIDWHDYMGGFGDSREVGAKVRFAGPVGKVPDEQTDSQGFLVTRPPERKAQGGSVRGSDSIPEPESSAVPPLVHVLHSHASGKGDTMKKPRAMAGTVVLVLTAALACDRAQTGRDVERAAEQVKGAAEQAGDKLADGWLTTKIQAQFFADEDIKSRYITVSSRDGVVRLKGFVEGDDVRRQVLEITKNTDGVKQVDDRELLVGRPVHEFATTSLPEAQTPVATTGVDSAVTRPAPTDDASVASMVQAGYFLDPMIKLRHIDVQSMNGVVTLKGQIASEMERAQALILARSAPGVVRVEDYLTVEVGLQ